jgi:hypothetical protein
MCTRFIVNSFLVTDCLESYPPQIGGAVYIRGSTCRVSTKSSRRFSFRLAGANFSRLGRTWCYEHHAMMEEVCA